MQEAVLKFSPASEYPIPEGCSITELSNTTNDEELSVARARVAPGVVTHAHRLRETAERYVILSGQGSVEVGTLPPREVGPGDVVLIPPGTRQRIANTGGQDLVFLALCTPRFRPENYEQL